MALIDSAIQQTKGIDEVFDNGTRLNIDGYLQEGGMWKVDGSVQKESIYTSTETLTGTRELTEFETPDRNNLVDGYKTILSARRYGNSIQISEEELLYTGDNTIELKKYIDRQAAKLIDDVTNAVVTLFHAPYNEPFSATNYAFADGKALCDVDHEYVSGGKFTNKLTGYVAGEDMLDKVDEYAGAFLDAAGEKPNPLSFDTIFVKKGSEAERVFKKLVFGDINPTQWNDYNIYEGMYRMVASPYITYANRGNVIFRDSSMDNSVCAKIPKYPTMDTPQKQDNLSMTIAATTVAGTGIINMPHDLLGFEG